MPVNIYFLKIYSLRIYQHMKCSYNFEATCIYQFSAIKCFEPTEVIHVILWRMLMDWVRLL